MPETTYQGNNIEGPGLTCSATNKSQFAIDAQKPQGNVVILNQPPRALMQQAKVRYDRRVVDQDRV